MRPGKGADKGGMMGNLAGACIGLVCSVPFPGMSFSKGTLEGISRNFHAAGIHGEKPGRYLSGALAISGLKASALFILLLISLPAAEAFAYSSLAFALVFSFFLLFPRLLAARRTAQAESELPFLLRELAVYLDIGLPFEKALVKISQRKYVLSEEFSFACQEIKSGGTVQSSLSEMSAKTDSLPLKRSLLLLSSIYETGASAEPLKRTSEELSSSQLSSMRLASSRLSMLSILFIAASALIPSFFTVFAAVSPAIGSGQMPEWQVWLAFIIIFPLLDLFALALMFLLLPPAPPNASGRGALLGEYLAKKGFALGTRAFAAILAAISLALAFVFMALGFSLLAALSICIAPAAYALAAHFAGKDVEEAESRLPDALYTAASTHKLLSAEKMLSALSKGGFGRLSESFELALRRQKAGDSFAASMQAAARHCPSLLVERAFSLLTVSYETGANMYFALRSAAEDVVSFFALVRERTAMLSMQRYTVLAASAILVPVILGAVVSLAPSLESATLLSQQSGQSPASGSSQEPGSPFSPQASASLSSVLLLACPAYLLLNAAISSILLALSENRPSKAALYFAISAPISQMLFAMSSASGITGIG